MRRQLFLILSIFLILSQAKLLFVSEAYRHGARGALSSYYDGKNQSDIAGQLTATGQRQHFNFGQILRNEYVYKQKFMSENYNYTEIYVRADDCDRTIMSAISHFQGFYPETFGAKLPENLPASYTFPPFNSTYELNTTIADNYALPHGIQVLPVHVFSKKSDFVFSSGSICLNNKLFIAEFMAENVKDSAYVDLHMAKVYLEISLIFKKPLIQWHMIEKLHDVLIADQFNGRPIPKISDSLWKSIKFLDDFSWFFMQSGSLRAVKLQTQPMMEEIFEKMDAAIAGSSPLKWLSLSGHDSNVAPLMRLFNFTDYKCLMNKYFNLNSTETYLNCVNRPGFASSVIIELHQNDQDTTSHHVKIRYNGDYMKLCEKESLECDYSEFKQRITSGFSKNFKLECGIETLLSQILPQNYSTINSSVEQSSSMTMIVILQSLILILLGLYIIKQKRLSKDIRQKYEMPIQQNLPRNEISTF